VLAWIIHNECRAGCKSLNLLSDVKSADFVEFSATKSSAWPFPRPCPAAGQPGA
jgi:hypothetical protein